MDKELLQLRIEHALKHIELAENDIQNVSFEEFKKTDLLKRAVSFSVAQIGEQLNTLEKYFGKEHPEINWKEAYGLRNLLIHDYVKTIDRILYDTVKNDLNVLKGQLQNLLKEFK